ncbi:MAG: Na/Pi cotransporter family protein [Campylobacterota bacterium]
MIKRITLPILLALLAYLLFNNEDAKVIIAGIAIFLIGMIFMEDGFKLFSGGILEKIIQKSTNSVLKSITTGFLSTSVVQSSSLISIIVISFLSAGLISLSGAIGIVFGSNIGTTTTAWIVSTFGVKIKISAYAMPMIIFGVLFRFSKNEPTKGFGNVLIGLGFVFLGISYMKDGFETLKAGLDLSQFALDGVLGMVVYVGLGAIATIIIQSSSATMALIITALATNQIVYMNALELAIGSNIGTTVTAVIASLAASSNGKRLAVAHFIFNIVTGVIAILFILPLADLVDYLAMKLSIAQNDYAMKLALFHTIFNVIGVLAVSPFTHKMEKFLKGLFISKKKKDSKPKFLDEVLIKVPDAALLSIKKEILHLYDNAQKLLSHGIYIHREDFRKYEYEKLDELILNSGVENIKINVESYYNKNIKSLYGEIVRFSALSQKSMGEEDSSRTNDLKVAARSIVEATKDIRDLNRNLNIYLRSDNKYVKREYNNLRYNLVNILKTIDEVKNERDDIEILSSIEVLKDNLKDLERVRNEKIDELIRDDKINTKMATSLINDATFAQDISKNLINAATILLIESKEIQELGD